MRPSTRFSREENGVAMVIAMLVVFVVVLLSLVVLDLSIHNTDQAAYDRKRVTSIAAAEAGINRAWNLVQFTAPEDLPCGTSVTDSLGSHPGPATFTIEFTWFSDTTGTAPSTCPLSQSNVPASVLITAVGETNSDVPRTMQSFLTLTANFGGFGSAILAVTDTTFNNAFTILGQNGNDGSIYVTEGDAVINNSLNAYGNLYVHDGGVHMENNATVNGEVWANEAITLENPATVGMNAISSTEEVEGTGTIGGFAMAGRTVDPNLDISGTTYENSPQGAPPTVDFPKLCQVAIAGVCTAMPWSGYTVTTATTCTAAQAFLDASLSGNQILWIPSGCPDLQIAQNDTITFSGNLAIVTNGKITMAQRNTWNGVSGKKLQFIVNYRTDLDCASGSYDITTGQFSNLRNASVLLYSPCTVTINNLNSFTGQVLGNSVAIQNNGTLSYQPVLVDGLDNIHGFNQNVVYIREVVS